MWTPKFRNTRNNPRRPAASKRWGGLGQLLRHLGPRRMQLEPLEERTLLSVGTADDPDQLLMQSLSTSGFTAPDCLTVSDEALAELETGTLASPPPSGSRPNGAQWYDTSEYMLGDVWVTVVLLESTDGITGESEDWTSGEIGKVKTEIREGLTWWEDTLAAQTGVLNDLSFTVDFTYADTPVQTGYEPINRPSTDQALWMNSFLDQVSHNSASSEYYDLKTWADDQRIAHNTDWAFTIFVVDSSVDTDGMFSNSRFAYAALGGPYVVMTYDNDGWGINDMSMVVAHETAHVFYALDEYSGSGCTYTDVSGYYGTQNLNAYDGNPNPGGRVMSMMGEATLQDQAYAAHTSSPTSRQMLGWLDSDGDGIYDVLDVAPTLAGSGSYNSATGNFEFSGTSAVQTLDNRNIYGYSHDITTNTIDLLQYRLDGGGWIDSSVSRMYSGAVSLDVPVGSGHHTLEFRTAVAEGGLASSALSFEFDVDTGLVDLVIDADDAAAGSANNGSGDQFLVQLDNNSGTLVEIYVNGVLVESEALANVQSIAIQGSSDLDTLTVYNGCGLVNPSGGVAFRGEALGVNTGTGDLLVVQGDSPSGTIARETYTVSGPTAGTLVLDPDGSAGIGAAAFVDDEQVITFQGLSLLTSLTTSDDLDTFLTNAEEVSAVEAGPIVGALQTAVVAPQDGSFLPIRFADKTNVSVNTLGGSDELTVNLTTAATGLAALSVYGHALNNDGPNVTATANETFHLYATPAGVTTTLAGQGGADSCSNVLSGSPGLSDLNGPVNVDGGANPSTTWTDGLSLRDLSDVTGDLVTLTASDLIGASPAAIHYLGLEAFTYDASRGADTIDILSTAAGVGYTISGTGDSDVITVGNTRANFDAGIRNGTLDAIAGSLLLKGGWHLPEGLDDHLNIDDSGTLAPDTQVSISDVASMRDNSTGWILEHVTKIAGFGLAGGEILCPTDDACGKWEVLNIRAGQGGNTIDVQLTSATVSTTIDSGTGNDTITINGDTLAAANTFLGNAGNDRFVLNATSAIAGTSLSIQGGAPASAPSNRDVLEITNEGDLARDVAISYPSAVDGSVNVTGLGTAVAVATVETLTYTGGAANDDAVSVHATPAADLITVAPITAHSASILVNGGLAGGAAGPDLLLTGLDASNGLLIDGSTPTDVLPGDVLVYESDGAGTLTSTTTGAGTIAQTGMITVAYQDIEEVQQGDAGVDYGDAPAPYPTVEPQGPAGSLDTTFGGDGAVITDMGGTDILRGVVVQSDGKTVAVGIGSSVYLTVARYLSDGTLDASFNGDGTLVFDGVTGSGAIALLEDGKVLVAGVRQFGLGFSVFRLNSDGSLDTTFGSDGEAHVAAGELSASLADLAVQPDGKIVVGGSCAFEDSQPDFVLARFNSDGSIDGSFGVGGVVRTDFTRIGVSQPEDSLYSVLVLPDGRIVAGGTTFVVSPDIRSMFAMACYLPDGSLDPAFGTSGKSVFTFTPSDTRYERITDLLVLDDGKILASSSGGSDTALLRFNPDGTLDTTFATAGRVIAPTPLHRYANQIRIDRLGGIVCVNGQGGIYVSRYLSDGTIDTNFGTGGITTVGFGKAYESSAALALGPCGEILVGGLSGTAVGSNYDWGLARLNGLTSSDLPAKHAIVSGFHLGGTIDSETDGQPDATATGDDLAGDDEDGVDLTGIVFNAGQTVSVPVTVALPAGMTQAWLDAWVDYDGDGFEAAEEVSVQVGVGINNVSFPVPADATIGTSFARFRLSSVGGLAPGGSADDGEVEDYQVQIGATSGVVTIIGDQDYADEDDVFLVVHDEVTGNLQVWLNDSDMTGTPEYEGPLSLVTQLNILGLGGNDSLIIRDPWLQGLVVNFDGGTGSDLLQVEGDGGTSFSQVTYSPGPASGAGQLAYDSALTIGFTNLEPVIDLAPAATLVVNGTGDANAISYQESPTLADWDRVSVDDFETIDFVGKTELVINGLGGADQLDIHLGTPATGLSAIVYQGGTANEDRVNVLATAAVDQITVTPAGPNSASVNISSGSDLPALVLSGLDGETGLVIDGRAPTAPAVASDGDLLFYDSTGTATIDFSGSDSGTITQAGLVSVAFRDIENLDTASQFDLMVDANDSGASDVNDDTADEFVIGLEDAESVIDTTALDAYVAEADEYFSYTLASTIDGNGYTGYIFDLKSQGWNPDGGVTNKTVWQHWLQIIVPDTISSSTSTAFLFISSGSTQASPPSSVDSRALGAALTANTISVYLPTVPNQPLQFADELYNHTEDEIVAYTFDKFLETGNENWPAYLAMVNSVVRAMDTVQAVVPGLSSGTLHVDDFVLSGASKRGWTTQLATAVDPQGRVKAMIPLVADLSRLDVQMAYHAAYYDGVSSYYMDDSDGDRYSVELYDYLYYDVINRLGTPEGNALLEIVDPYSYKDRATMAVPKYYVNGTGDQFFVPGSAQFYLDEMNGPTYLRYVPNAGHGLNEDAVSSVFNFYAAIAAGDALPEYDWSIEDGGTTINLDTVDTPVQVLFWTATNPEERDFRLYEDDDPVWTSTELTDLGGGHYEAHLAVPSTGAVAGLIEVHYMVGGKLIKFSTSVSVLPEVVVSETTPAPVLSSAPSVLITVNGTQLPNVPLDKIANVLFQGSADTDTLTVNADNGTVNLSGAIYFDGEALGANSGQRDTLVLTGDPGTEIARETYLVGSTEDAGTWVLDANDSCGPGALLSGRDGDEQVVVFSGLAPVESDVPVEVFDVILSTAGTADSVVVEDGSPIGDAGYASTQLRDAAGTFESVQFAHKETLRVHGMDGADSFAIDNPNAAQDLLTVELWGHAAPDVAAVLDPSDDASGEWFMISQTDAAAWGVLATTWSLYGQDGDDQFDNIYYGTYAFSLDEIRGALSIFGGEGSDLVDLQDSWSTASVGDSATLTSTTLTGAAPAVIAYADVEGFAYEASSLDDTIDVLSTQGGTDYILSGDGGNDTVTIGATAATFNTGVGSLAGIEGNITLWPDFNRAAGTDRLNVDASGMDSLAAPSASVANIGLASPPFGGYEALQSETTALVGFASASIFYAHGPVGGFGDSALEYLHVVASQGADTIEVNDTTASVQTTIDAYTGDDANTLIINGDGLSANNLFLGNAGNDRFVLNVTSDLGASSVVPLESVRIEGNEHDSAAAFDLRDRLEINDLGAGTSRMLFWEYGADLLEGFAVPVAVLTMETVTYNGDSANDDYFVVITTLAAEEELTFAPTGSNSGLVFLGGSPWRGPSADFYASLPGVAGGSLGPDLRINGIATEYGVYFSGGDDDRLYVYAPSERNVEDDGNRIDGDGNVVIPGAPTLGLWSAYDSILVSDTNVEILSDGYWELLNANIVFGAFTQASDLTDGLVVNAGFEDLPGSGGAADSIVASPSFAFPIRINGGDPVPAFAPQGDRLEVTAPGAVNVFNDKANPSEITITSSDPATGTLTHPLRFTSIESTVVTVGSASQTVNLIGDNNDPAIDQSDSFVVVGADVDSLLSPIFDAQPEFQPDADGDNEFFLQLNGSLPIAFRNVTHLNAWGDDAAGAPSVGPNDVDRLEVMPYTDDTPQGWGIDVAFDEGNPMADAIDTPDLLVYNGVAGVSEEIHVVPTGPGTGQLVVRNAADGSVIVVIDYTTNTGIEINPNDGSAGDTDTLVLHGTDGADLATVDFGATGLAGDPLVSFRDATSGGTLYELFSTTTPFGFDVVRFELGLGDDAIDVVDLAGKVVEVDGGLPVGSDVLRVATASAAVHVGTDPTSGSIELGAGAVHFAGMERIEVEGDGSGDLTVYGTNDADAITVAGNTVAVNDGSLVAFQDYQSLNLLALAGSDEISVDGTAGITTGVVIDGGDPATGSDRLIVAGTTALDVFRVLLVDADSMQLAGAILPIVGDGIEQLSIDGRGGGDVLVVTTPEGEDTILFTPGATADAGRVETWGPGGGSTLLPVSFTDFGAGGILVLEDASGNNVDVLGVNGTALSDRMEVDYYGYVQIVTPLDTPRAVQIHTPGIRYLGLYGLEGDDTFVLSGPLPFWATIVDGGDPSSGSDVLNYVASGWYTTTLDLGYSTITENGAGPVAYTGVEQVSIGAGGGSVAVRGTSGSDALTYTPTAYTAGQLALAGTATQFQLTGTYGLSIDGLGDEDLLAVNGTTADNAIIYNRSTGGIAVDSLLGVTATGFEALQIQAGLGNDTVTVSGAGGPALTVDGGLPTAGSTATADTLVVNMPAADTVTAIPGDTPDSGVLDFTTAAADLSYLGMTLLSIVGSSGADTLVARGTDGNDTFAAGRDGSVNRVTIDSRAAIAFSAVETLTLDGRNGDDAFSVSPVGLTGTSTINVQGGGPTASDTLVVNGTAAQETIGFLPTAADAGSVTIGGAPTVVFSTTEAVTINGQGGNDALTITTPAGSQTITYLPGASIDEASVRASGLVSLAFLGLGTTGSVSLANAGGTRQDTLVYQGDAADDTFTVSGAGSGSVGLNSQLPISTPGISGLELRGLEGSDTFNVTGSLPFTATVLSGGGPSGSDIANVVGSGAAVTASLGGSTPSLSGGGLGTVTLSGIESLNLNASSGVLTVSATANNDQAVFTPTGTAAGTLAVNNASPILDFSNAATFNLDLGGGADRLTVNGTANPETIAASGTAVTVGSLVSVAYSNAEALAVNGLQGPDTFNVTPGAIAIFIDGGDPIGTTPGDQLNIVAGGSSVSFEAGPESDEGAFLVGAFPRVSFDHIEGLSVTGPGSVLVLGTNADDDITIIARDAASSPQYPLTDGKRDFTVSVNAGPEILFLDAATLYIDGLAGDDDIVVRAPAPNGADWDVDLFVAGGTPAPDTGRLGDVLVLETPGNNSVIFTPTGADTGTLVLAQPSSNSTITMGPFSLTLLSGEVPVVYTSSPGGVDRVEYDGENGTDQFAVALDASVSEVVTYRFDPSTSKGSVEIDAGQLQRLGVDFSNIANNGQIAINDAGGTDVLVYDGTEVDDVISVASSGVITNLTGFVPLATAGIETLWLMGLEGDDVFNIAAGHPFAGIDVRGGDPSESDVLNLTGNASAQTVAVNLGPATITGFGGTISYLGVEQVNVDGGAGVDTLTANGTAVDDRITYTPTGQAAGTFQLEGSSTSFAFSQIAGSFTINGADELADEVVVLATNSHDVITVDARNAIRRVTVENVLGVDLKPVVLGSSVESVTVQGRLGNDTFLVVPDAGIAPVPLGNLLINIDGGAPSASDALVIAADAAGTALDNDAHFVIVNHSRSEDEGVVRIFRDTAGTGNAPTQLPDISFVDVEVVSPLLDGVDAATGDPNLLILGPDQYEQNEYRSTAAYLGSGSALNITDLAIFPNATEHPFVPADQDWFRFVAQTTGTLDFQVYFQAYSTELLPGGGDLDIAVYDATGHLIDSSTGVNDDERIRIPVVAGQTYYLRVMGNDNAVNGYDMTVVNTDSPVPYDLELDDLPVNGTTNPPGQNDNSDTGRSQTDNITYDNTPVIRFRLDDGFFLHDLPGNATDNNPPDQVIPIPFNADQTATTGTAGYRIAIYDEGTPQQSGQLPQSPIGYARQIAEGVYEFNFATDALNPANPDGATTSYAISDGSHFLSARVEIIDPATPNETGLSGRSVSLEIVVDTVMPAASFGETAVTDDGLHPDSDSGIEGQPGTFTDNITSDTTPTFWGYAEADAYVRVYVDVNNDGAVTAGVDVQIAQTVAIANDGTNQYRNGYWEATSYVDLNDPEAFPTALALDGVRHILVTAEDVAGNLNKGGALGAAQTLSIFIDTRGPQVSGVFVTGHETYDLFDPKPSTDGPSPLVESLDIVLTDRPTRVNGFLYPAVNEILATQPGNIVLVGDNSGVISIASIEVIDATVVGGVVRTTVRLNFVEPLPDDRFTLTVSDRIKDDAGNALDGESNAQEPQENPQFPSGDSDPGEDFVARFTIDTRPEIGVWGAGSVSVDINGNFTFDPQVDDQTQDSTNRDIGFKFGYTSDDVFAGKFTGPGADGIFNTADDPAADGFDRLAAYGQVDGQYRWLIDTDNDGVADLSIASVDAQGVPGPGLVDPAGINGLPAAGNFDGNAWNGDEVAVFTGTSWWLDTNHDYQVDTEVESALGGGYPIIGDFDGDGLDDLGTWCDDIFRFDLASNGFGQQDASIAFGFTGVRERPATADMDADGIDDLGLFVPDHSGTNVTTGQWYFLISNDSGAVDRVTGTINTLAHAFTPEPFGSDVSAQFGDMLAKPVVGNFDPPVTGKADEPALATRVLAGTTGNDVLEIAPGESGRWTVTLNGVEYPAAGDTVTISFDGLGGRDTVRVTGTDGTETVTLKPGSLEVNGDGFTITATNVENFRVDGAGGADTVRMYDGTGNDTLTVKPGTATLTGSVTYTALNFETVHAYASTGTDTANLYDTAGDNLLEMSPSFGRISGDGILYRAVGFETIQGYASTGKDRATFAGSTGNDVFQATPTWARMTGTGFTKRQANGFDTVEAYGKGGSDTAKLSGSASSNDTLKAYPQKATLTGTGFKQVVDGFNTITVYGGAGGNDTAQLNDSAGNDTFRASPQTASMSCADTGYLVSASQFELIQGISSGKGKDTAYLSDSTGNDTFWANSTLARMYGTGYNLRARSFDYVHGTASSGHDVAQLFGTAAAEQVIAESSQTRLIGKTFFQRARYFDEVYTDAGGGSDTATVYDATVPTEYGMPAGMKSADFAQLAWFYHIEKVQLRKTSDSSQKTDIENADAVFAYWS